MNKIAKAHLALFGANLIYGINYTVAKELMPDLLSPFGFIFCRVVGALLLFWLLSSFIKWERVANKDLLRMAVCGIFGVAGNQLMFFYGLNLTSPINAAIIMTCNPILVLLISALLIRERVTFRKIGGILLGLTGATGLILYNNPLNMSPSDEIGDLFIFLNASSYAIYLVLVKPLMQKYSPITVIKWVFLFGFFIVIPFGIEDFLAIEWSRFTGSSWLSFLFVVVCTTFLAYLFNIFGLKELNPSTVSTYIYSQPLIASFVALSLGKDELTWVKIIATIFIFTGVYLVSIKGRNHNQKTPA
ncbi:MAG: DMT family transporter [Vicingaceae bacterium]